MCAQELKISNVMSLDGKVSVIRAFYKMSTMEERITFRKSHEQINNIILNRTKILEQHSMMQTRVEALKKGFKLSNIRERNESENITLLEKVLVEWYQRYQMHVVPSQKITFKMIREQIEMAKDVLNIRSFTPSNFWMMQIRSTCNKTKCRKFDANESLSLLITDVTRYVLKKAGISKAKAQSKYGIYIYGEEFIWKTVETDTSVQVPSLSDDEEEPMKVSKSGSCKLIDNVLYEWESSEEGRDDDEAPTSTNNGMQANKIENNYEDALKFNEEESIEVSSFDDTSCEWENPEESRDNGDAATSTKDIMQDNKLEIKNQDALECHEKESIEVFSSGSSKLVNNLLYEWESCEESRDVGDAATSTNNSNKLERNSEDALEYLKHECDTVISNKDCIEDDQLTEYCVYELDHLKYDGDTASSAKGCREECQLLEDNKDTLGLIKHYGDAVTSLGDNKDALEHLKHVGETTTQTKDSAQGYQVLRNYKDVLEHLKPLRDYLLLQENYRALETVKQLESNFSEVDVRNNNYDIK